MLTIPKQITNLRALVECAIADEQLESIKREQEARQRQREKNLEELRGAIRRVFGAEYEYDAPIFDDTEQPDRPYAMIGAFRVRGEWSTTARHYYLRLVWRCPECKQLSSFYGQNYEGEITRVVDFARAIAWHDALEAGAEPCPVCEGTGTPKQVE